MKKSLVLFLLPLLLCGCGVDAFESRYMGRLNTWVSSYNDKMIRYDCRPQDAYQELVADFFFFFATEDFPSIERLAHPGFQEQLNRLAEEYLTGYSMRIDVNQLVTLNSGGEDGGLENLPAQQEIKELWRNAAEAEAKDVAFAVCYYSISSYPEMPEAEGHYAALAAVEPKTMRFKGLYPIQYHQSNG